MSTSLACFFWHTICASSLLFRFLSFCNTGELSRSCPDQELPEKDPLGGACQEQQLLEQSCRYCHRSSSLLQALLLSRYRSSSLLQALLLSRFCRSYRSRQDWSRSCSSYRSSSCCSSSSREDGPTEVSGDTGLMQDQQLTAAGPAAQPVLQELPEQKELPEQ